MDTGDRGDTELVLVLALSLLSLLLYGLKETLSGSEETEETSIFLDFSGSVFSFSAELLLERILPGPESTPI